ncbi:MAG: hypothetical protein JWN67_1135 [Actinomycetia bacterium]|nr:hypothetical protein [Actinomycetes bacterium]
MATAWFDLHRERLRELFRVLGISDHWSDDLGQLVRWMEETWLGAEHGRQSGKPVYTPADRDAALPLLTEMGLVGAVEPPADRYGEIVVLGAAGIGLHRRLGLVRSSGVTADGLTVLAGLRPHEQQERDGGLDELLDAGGRFAAAPGWGVPALLARQRDLLAAAGIDDQHAAAAVVLPSETDLAELLLLKQWPEAVAVSTTHAPPHPVVNELGQRAWALRTWRAEGQVSTLRLLNGTPVERRGSDGSPRPSRPTTRSTFAEWMALVAADTSPSSILAVVNQPHLGRVRLQLRSQLADGDLAGVHLDVAGCATLAEVDLVLVLGEIPAWIRADGVL